ncbi:MAG: peptidoglycan-binding protein [Candidatus Limiplasma sp.]|nr:peptidoglycan-binding protein [Candidatus Limiplasma sp.]
MNIRPKRALAMVLALVLTLSLTLGAKAATYPYDTQSGESVKLRKSANTTSVVLANINAGDTVTVLGKSGNFYKIKYNTVTGYAMIRYIDGADESTIPVTSQDAMTAINSYPYDTSTLARVKLRKTASETATSMLVIPEDALVTVYDVTSNGFAKVKYAGRTGYVMTAYILLAAIPTPTPVPTSTANPGEAKYTPVQTGSTGSHVRALQEALTELGFYKSTVDSKFGAGTKSAVTAFETKNSLKADGIADTAMQYLLYEGRPRNVKGTRKSVKTVPMVSGVTIRGNDTGEAVEKFQKRLKELGYYTAEINGVCDRATVNALKAFQGKMGLTKDGVATPDVLTILNGATAVSAGETVTPTPSPTVAPPTGTLRQGDTGTDVKKVQQRLKDLGYFTATVDGKFGDATVKALQAFQKKNGLTQDGVCGTQTRAVLFAQSPVYANATPTPTPVATTAVVITEDTAVTIQSGSRGSAVLNLQKRLTELGYYTARMDGVYLADDITAVRAFQKANNLTVDGKAGYLTQKLIYSDTALRGDLGTTTLTTTLRYGDTGTNVTTLQNRLIELGYLVGTADGTFGTSTKAALVAFQTSNGLTRDGVAGANTQAILFSNTAVKNTVSTTATLKQGTISDTVKDMQERLIALGYLTGKADGNFGAQTALALMAFQSKNGLSADGVAGSLTLAKLNSLSAKSSDGTTSTTTTASAPTLSGAPSAASVRYANWYTEVKARCKLYPYATVYDFTTGLSWKVHMFSFGAHADAEPLTAEDTANMEKAFGNTNTWTPKAVWVVFSDGRVYMASTHDMPHEVQHITTNNFAGHLCIHFPRTAEQVAAIGPYATSHQKAIDLGWAATLARVGK